MALTKLDEDFIKSLRAQLVNFHGRRIINAGDAIDPQDYVTLKQVTSGVITTPHSSTHEKGGNDEIDVTGLAGLLAEAQNPLPHTTGLLTDFSFNNSWTPTTASLTNLNSAIPSPAWRYHRLGKIVLFAGRIFLDPTEPGILTACGLSLPIASNFTSLGHAAGDGIADPSLDVDAYPLTVLILPDTTNDRLSLSYISNRMGTSLVYCKGFYLIN